MRKQTPEIQGIYLATGKGYGFLRPDDGGGDYFIPPRAQAGAWHGDRVSATLGEESGGEPGRRTAAVTEILGRANKTVTGTLMKQGRRLWLVPDSDRLPGPILIPGRAAGAHAGDKAAVRMVSFGGGRAAEPMGTLQALFGRADSREAAADAILYEHGISPEFPPEVRAAAGEVPAAIAPEALSGRLDLREDGIITIDGASAKDLDDAVFLRRDGEGRFVLGVHIADVSHYVSAGSPLDEEAFLRGTSVYFADRVVPMLPPALSNGICSLLPGEDRLTVSCLMTFSPEGEVVEHTLAKSVIRSAVRMTYEDCNALLAGEDEALERRYAALLPMLREMKTLSDVLARRRRLRGSLDLDGAEVSIHCDKTGAPVGAELRRSGASERIIESFMLAANETVAEHLSRLKAPAVYRVHEAPGEEKKEALRAALALLGYPLVSVDNFPLQKALKSAKDTPAQAAVSMLVLRSLMKARYDTENLGHMGLAARYYCHFTSPIRRYPDLMVHRILTALLAGGLEGRSAKKLAFAARRSAVQSSERELAAQTAEREIEKRYLAEYMRGRIGEEFSGAVSGVTRFGLFVALSNGAEGFLPLEALPGGAYEYDEGRMTLFEAGGKNRFSVGTPTEVICAAADAASGRIDLRLAGLPAPAGQADTQTARQRKRGGGVKQKMTPAPGARSGKKSGGRRARAPGRGKRGKH